MPVNSYSGKLSSDREKKLKIYQFGNKIDFGTLHTVNATGSYQVISKFFMFFYVQ